MQYVIGNMDEKIKAENNLRFAFCLLPKPEVFHG